LRTESERSQRDKIILAAQGLSPSPFTLEALIVAAWRKFPQDFGLKGFAAAYPDSNKVTTCVVGRNGLIARGALKREGPKCYSLTDDGRLLVELMAGPARRGGPRQRLAKPIDLPPLMRRFLGRILESAALDLFIQGLAADITFPQACAFWSMPGGAGRLSMDEFDFALAFLKEALADGETILGNGRAVSAQDLAHLGELHEALRQRFARHLKLAGNRSLTAATRL
jgi:hypothetical protein